MKDPLVSLRGVALTLHSNAGPVEILRGIDLDVPAGETLGLVGPSGSGKSTLLMVMAGLEAVTAGTVEVDGTALKDLNEDALARFRGDAIGIVFQSFHLIPTMTALENVALPLELAGARDAQEKAALELDQVGLSHRLDHYPGQLSGGEQQRVAIARALVTGARLVLADEPTGNLDQETGTKIVDLLFSLHAARGMTLVLVTHDRDLAGRCSRVAHLADGRIASIASGQPSAAIATAS